MARVLFSQGLSGFRPPFSDSRLQPLTDEDIHRRLAHWNHERLSPAVPSSGWREDLAHEHAMRLLEGEWIEAFRRMVAEEAAGAPRDEKGFVDWFEDLKITGAGQNDPLFDWLASEADADQMNWFLTQEAAGEAGFDDLLALAQVKIPCEAKLELARNYWDEMGRGTRAGMHGPMLEAAVKVLDLQPSIETTLWPSLALANTLTAFSTTRRYAWHAIGALGVVELTAPTRVAKVAAGLKRLGRPPAVRKYFHLHAVPIFGATKAGFMPSTVIRRFSYEEAARRLEITFTSGRRYQYHDVPGQSPPDCARPSERANISTPIFATVMNSRA